MTSETLRSAQDVVRNLHRRSAMDWSFLAFVGQPWFVLPWYAVGALGALFLVYDMRNRNTALKPAMKWAWPIIVLFFSVIGLALYFTTARSPGVDQAGEEEKKKKAHDRYEETSWRRVNGAVIHCVAGDGFGIMSAMVLARAGGMTFWQEFWFEYLIGFVIGWLVFQRKSMTMMTDNLPKQLAMAFRGEFFSMLTVMGGMGAVMTYVTPMVVTAQPKPLTYAFWGFGMLGLLVGFVFTFPMNWLMVKLGWKHGMGGMQAAKEKELEGTAKRGAILAVMTVLGGAALVLVAWLTNVREDAPIRAGRAALVPSIGSDPGGALFRGTRATLDRAVGALSRGRRTPAAEAMDEALRAAEAGTHFAPGAFYSTLEEVRNARIELQRGREAKAILHLEAALRVLEAPHRGGPPNLDVNRYRGARIIDPEGAIIGEVTGVSGASLEVALGGWRNAWGLFDFGRERRAEVPSNAVAFGPPGGLAPGMVVLPTKASIGTAEL